MLRLKLTLLFFISPLLAGALFAAESQVSVTSEVYPARARTGESVRYRINIEIAGDPGTRLRQDIPNATLPRIDGIELQYLGSSTRTQSSFSNLGTPVRSATLTLNYTLRAAQPGSFRIPGFELIFRGEVYAVPPAEVSFFDRDDPADSDHPPLLRLELLLPREKLFVGQTVKGSLQLFALDRIPNLRNGHPVKIGDAFAEGKLESSQTRSRAVASGHHYDVYSRPLTLTPIRSGRRELGYEMDVQALLPVDGSLFDQKPSTGNNSVFNDPLFRQFRLQTDPRMEYQTITVVSEPQSIEIHPLPLENRPEFFSGAIGEFTLRAFPSANSVRLGDPLKLRIQLAGQGNFDRILAPEIDLGQRWKSYSPETSFRPGDSLGFSGVKNFDFTLIPLAPDIDRLPEISIAYFDPRSESYEVLTTGEIPIHILENPDFDGTGPELELLANEITRTDEPTFTLRLHPGNLTPPQALLLSNPLLVATQTLPLIAIGLLALVRWQQRRWRRDLVRQRRRIARRRMNALQASLHEIVQAGDSRSFHARLLEGVRICLSIPHGERADAATRVELEEMLDQCGFNTDHRDALSQLLDESERSAFSDQQTSIGNLTAIRHRWEKLLNLLEKQVER